jgi:hypothetical protein
MGGAAVGRANTEADRFGNARLAGGSRSGLKTDIHTRSAIPGLVSVRCSLKPLTDPIIATADAGY